MSSCRRWRDHLVEAVWDEIDEPRRAQLEAHLASCPGCATELDALAITARRAEQALPPRPQAADIDVWSRLLPALDEAAPPPPTVGLRAAALLAAASLAIGLGLGLVVRPGGETAGAGSPAPRAVVAGLDAELARFLERSTPLLLAVANRRLGDGEVASYHARERPLAESLAADAEGLARRLDAQGRGRQASLVAELGMVFLQMSNLPPREYHRGLEVVQATIESRALLFQLSAWQMRHL